MLLAPVQSAPGDASRGRHWLSGMAVGNGLELGSERYEDDLNESLGIEESGDTHYWNGWLIIGGITGMNPTRMGGLEYKSI